MRRSARPVQAVLFLCNLQSKKKIHEGHEEEKKMLKNEPRMAVISRIGNDFSH
jgi:hypothetical protein